MKAVCIAFSANKSLKKFGIRKAILKISANLPAPTRNAIPASLKNPKILDMKVAREN